MILRKLNKKQTDRKMKGNVRKKGLDKPGQVRDLRKTKSKNECTHT